MDARRRARGGRTKSRRGVAPTYARSGTRAPCRVHAPHDDPEDTPSTSAVGRGYAPDGDLPSRPAASRTTPPRELGRASCRERGGQYVSISVVGVSINKKKKR